jgi:hypothetical protein
MDRRNAVLVSAGYAEYGPLGDDAAGGAMYCGILFDLNQATISLESQPRIAELVRLLAATPEMEVLIVGCAEDGRGGFERQKSLCERRVLAVANVLVASGIAAARLTPVTNVVMPEPGRSHRLMKAGR